MNNQSEDRSHSRVYQDGLVTVTDTRNLPWASPPVGEPFHGTQTRTKVLARADEGWACVQMITRGPDAVSSYAHGQPERHLHRTVHEWVYIVSGSVGHRVFEAVTDPVGTGFDLSTGHFMERHPGPGTWHGVDPDRQTYGYVGLEFRSGPGQAAGEVGAEIENASVLESNVGSVTESDFGIKPTSLGFETSYPQENAVRYETKRVRIIDTRELHWKHSDQHDFAIHGEVMNRILSHGDKTNPLFQQVFLTPEVKTDARYRLIAKREMWMILSGGSAALQLEGLDNSVTLKPGFFVDLREGSKYSLSPLHKNNPGMDILIWRPGESDRLASVL